MSIVEINAVQELTRVQRWSHYITLGIAVVALIAGINARNSAFSTNVSYTNIQAGLLIRYPENWLIDENSDEYLVRVRDMTRVGYKTTIQIGIDPISENTDAWNILLARSLRLANLATYRPFEIEPDVALPNDISGARMIYTFTATDPNPSLESLPTVVIGVDVVTIRRGQAISITFLTDARTYQEDLAIFDRFLETLEFQ